MTRDWARRGAMLIAVLGIAATGAPIDASKPAAAAPSVVMSFTGAVHGYLDVCGCARFPLGSLARRATQMSSFQRRWPGAVAFAVDAGDFSDLPGPAGAVKTRALIEAMNELGYRAAGIGARDLAAGTAALTELRAVARFPFLSANLLQAATGTPWLPASDVIEANGLRIGIVAAMRHDPLASWTLPDGSRLVTGDPAPAIAQALPSLAGKAQLVVLLASMPLEDARLVARRVPGIDIVVGGYGGQVTLRPVVEGDARIIYLDNEGKFLGLASIFRPKDPQARPTFEIARYQLAEDVASDARWAAYTVEAMARSQEAEDEAQRAAAAPQVEPRFAGAGSCTGCHPAIVEQWSKTPHAGAWKTLTRGAKKPQATCVPCHVTGHGEPGGFADERATPHLLGVGCESCHGPAAEHMADPVRPYGKTGLASCTGCHTAEMDPTFNYYRDRQLVMHGSRAP